MGVLFQMAALFDSMSVYENVAFAPRRFTKMKEAEIAALEQKLMLEKKGALLRHKDRILHEIEQDIVGRYYFQRGKVRKNLVNDPEVKEAIKLLNDSPRYKAILSGQ